MERKEFVALQPSLLLVIPCHPQFLDFLIIFMLFSVSLRNKAYVCQRNCTNTNSLLISLLKQNAFINLMFRTILNYFILCILRFGQHACLYTNYLPRACGDQRMGLDHLEVGGVTNGEVPLFGCRKPKNKTRQNKKALCKSCKNS